MFTFSSTCDTTTVVRLGFLLQLLESVLFTSTSLSNEDESSTDTFTLALQPKILLTQNKYLLNTYYVHGTMLPCASLIKIMHVFKKYSSKMIFPVRLENCILPLL